ncbi:N-acetylmuramoyl-L-alanine amidase [Mesobacillus persicus]|uniref:N-acetylmuramoyl-L-alanine amidase n=1 Tax=Mesobacillus persicus TaxID=930146 RepID=A0A1H7XNG3_9BACI|nr:N-acetylmuramoyl-L-alanine amidase [Mesobacillus persicus]SEM34529.1 N-acetylmuramoyl-L-alanine amidase [Mesobacillus persicus]
MGKLVALCDGHGANTAGKRSPDGMRENEFNKAVMNHLKVELERHGLDTLLVAPTDADTSLSTRTNLANAKNADIYVSIHANANNGQWGSWGGIETYHYPNSKTGKKLADVIHNEVIKGSPLKNRGVKSANFHVLRETKMPAILLELGFMDSRFDINYLKSDAYRQECAIEIAKGICKYFGITYKEKQAPQPTSNKYYRIQIGAFSNSSNAKQYQEELLEKYNLKTIIKYYSNYHRVQIGAYSSKSNAIRYQEELLKKYNLKTIIKYY